MIGLLEAVLGVTRSELAYALDGVAAGVIVGSVCGVIGVFAVLRRLSLVGDATGHATLPGVALAFLLVGSKSLPALLTGALITGLTANLVISTLIGRPRTRPDAVIGVVLSVSFGLGVVLLSVVQASPTGAQSGLQSFLYGSAAGISREQVRTLGALGAAAIMAVAIGKRPLVLSTFDPVFARTAGVHVGVVRLVSLIVLAFVVVLSIRTVGVVLVSAMLVIPPSAALLFCRRIEHAILVAAAVGAFSGALGAWASLLHEGVATGPAMVVIAGAIFAMAFALSRARSHWATSVAPERRWT